MKVWYSTRDKISVQSHYHLKNIKNGNGDFLLSLNST